ncbi:MAG: purine-nucleoside phosphorylase [Acidobacteria bacterium]|nr:purine-nucleoside phosphorylase [Acidobacteriota bacterium]
MSYYEQVATAAEFVRSQSRVIPAIAVVLGSGLGDFASSLADAVSLSYDQIPAWPASTVVGHQGRFVMGEAAGRPIVALSGRVHAYEGHDLRAVTFGTRVLGVLGIKTLILTNAAGGVNTRLSVGELMVIDDHINLVGGNPLVGPNDDRFGPRFPDMTEVYSGRLRGIADQAGSALGFALPHGVYVAWHGPSYETPAEIRYLRTIGGDAIGMSTVPEAIVARHMGIEVLGISCITNMAAGVLPRTLNHDEVLETSHRAMGRFIGLLQEIISRL